MSSTPLGSQWYPEEKKSFPMGIGLYRDHTKHDVGNVGFH